MNQESVHQIMVHYGHLPCAKALPEGITIIYIKLIVGKKLLANSGA